MPRRRRCEDRGASRANRSSAPRRHGHCAVSRCRTRGRRSALSPLARRSSEAVRSSCIVSSIPATVETRVQLALHERERLEQARQPLQRVVLGLHRHDHPVHRHELAHGQRARRGRAVEQDASEAVPYRVDRLAQALERVDAGRLDVRARQLPRRRATCEAAG